MACVPFSVLSSSLPPASSILGNKTTVVSADSTTSSKMVEIQMFTLRQNPYFMINAFYFFFLIFFLLLMLNTGLQSVFKNSIRVCMCTYGSTDLRNRVGLNISQSIFMIHRCWSSSCQPEINDFVWSYFMVPGFLII